jgi:polysaccharide export outer membrane protein
MLGAGCAHVKTWLPKKMPFSTPSSVASTNPAPVVVVSNPPPVEVVVAPVVKNPETVSVAHRAPYRLRPGDPVIIYLRGIMPKDEQIEEIVDDRGMVTLPYIDDVSAVGRTSSELEQEVQRIYIERKIYHAISVNVVMPSQSYFIQGEIREPQRFPLMTGTTLLQAIAAAGGYTEYADRKRVTLTRGGEVRVFNMREIERKPQQDISIESGDVIRVPRGML